LPRLFVALLYAWIATIIATHGAAGLVGERWEPLAQAAMLVFLLLIGYAGFGITFDKQKKPFAEQGLPLRLGWKRELGLGLAFGWALALIAVLPMVFIGGIVIRLHLGAWDWVTLVAELAFFALATLAEEIVFRGYAFQKLVKAAGGFNAALVFAAIYAIIQARVPGANLLSTSVSYIFSLLLAAAYLRSRALWVSWGVNFGWKASRALLFGLTIAGVNQHSPVVIGDPVGPFWLTGGGYGLDASWTALVLLIVALPIIFRLTRDLNFYYNAPVIEPGGIPVEIGAAVQKQHDEAMGTTATPPPLVQIVPLPKNPE
jgi:membrane protease YdiL (CAAX protease family)